MKKISLPSFCIEIVINEIVRYMEQNQGNNKSGIIRNLHESNRLLPYFNKIESDYFEAGKNLQSLISKLEQSDEVLGIEKSQMKELYIKFYSSESSFRTELYKLTPRCCPICDAEWGYAVRTLDHILPESIFPQLAILPINLVSKCSRCNHSKNSIVGYLESQGVLNPYFNSLNLLPYLKCYTYIKGDDFITHIQLKNESVVGLDTLKYQRLRFFYEKVYKLNETYSEVARVSVLNSLIDTLSELGDVTNDFIKGYFQSLITDNKEDLISKGVVTLEFLKVLVLESLQDLEVESYDLINRMVQERRQMSEVQDIF